MDSKIFKINTFQICPYLMHVNMVIVVSCRYGIRVNWNGDVWSLGGWRCAISSGFSNRLCRRCRSHWDGHQKMCWSTWKVNPGLMVMTMMMSQGLKLSVSYLMISWNCMPFKCWVRSCNFLQTDSFLGVAKKWYPYLRLCWCCTS